MSDPISLAMERAASQQPFTPDLDEALRRGRRRKVRRRRTAMAASVLGMGVIAGIVTVALPGHHEQTAELAPAPVTSTATPSAIPSTTTPSPSSRTPADPAIVKQVTTLSPAVFAAAGVPVLVGGVKKVSGPPLVFDGKPGVLWAGAEYCPYCAAQRWPMVVALSRFGTWAALSTTTSSSSDVFPDTATFSFYGATFTSPYLTLQSVETETNRPLGSGYAALETPTAVQSELLKKYNPGGSIPFLDFGNRFSLTGASYDPSVLSGKSASQIASALIDPTTQIGKDVLSTANAMSAAICRITGNKPATVCESAPIAKLTTGLAN